MPSIRTLQVLFENGEVGVLVVLVVDVAEDLFDQVLEARPAEECTQLAE